PDLDFDYIQAKLDSSSDGVSGRRSTITRVVDIDVDSLNH
ncbi:unnamed protein product, partial [Rotaria magnacalcarata]